MSPVVEEVLVLLREEKIRSQKDGTWEPFCVVSYSGRPIGFTYLSSLEEAQDYFEDVIVDYEKDWSLFLFDNEKLIAEEQGQKRCLRC